MMTEEFPGKEVVSACQSHQAEYLNEAMKYIEEHLSPFLTIKEVASVIHKHPSDLDRMFSRANGVTIKRYIDGLCKEQVERMLSQGIVKGSDIAMHLGFRDDQAFYRWIRRVFAIPFRQLQQSSLPGQPIQRSPERAAG